MVSYCLCEKILILMINDDGRKRKQTKIPCNRVLDRAGENMPIMRKPGSKGRAIIESILWATFFLAAIQRCLESIDPIPVFDDLFLFFRKVVMSFKGLHDSVLRESPDCKLTKAND
jgi:hypothetical protein